MLLDPIPLGIILGLFIGKQIGVCGFIWIADTFGLIERPATVNWIQIWGLSLLTAIGFTVSLFIGNLAFADNPAYLTEVRMSILLASTLAAISGYTILRLASTYNELGDTNLNVAHPEYLEEPAEQDGKAA